MYEEYGMGVQSRAGWGEDTTVPPCIMGNKPYQEQWPGCGMWWDMTGQGRTRCYNMTC